MTLNISGDDLTRLKNLIDMGVRTTVEIKDLKDSLREATGETAKELDLPKKLLNDAIRVAAKAQEKGSVEHAMDEKQEELDSVQELLNLVGRK